MNKNLKLRIAVCIAIISIIDLAVIGLLLYEIIFLGKIEINSIVRTAIVVLSSVVATVKIFWGRIAKTSPAVYRSSYAHIIGRAFENDPKLEKMFFKGVDAYNKNQNTRGIRIFESLLQDLHSDDDRFATLVFIALCYTETGAYAAAADTYRKALMIKENSTAVSNLGHCLNVLGDFDGALEAYQRAIDLDPKNAYAYNNVAQILLEDEEYKDALEYAIVSARLNRNLYQAYNAQAICYAMLGDKERFEEALRLSVMHGGNKGKIIDFCRELSAPIFD